MTRLETIPIFDSAFKADPHPFYRDLHHRGPVTAGALPNGTPCWLVTDIVVARALILDERLSKDSRYAGTDWHRAHVTYDEGTSHPVFSHLLTMDPPRHTELRQLVARSFTRTQIEKLRPTVHALVCRTIDAMPTDRVVDFVAEFALTVPLTVICELIGVPIEDRDSFHRWSTVLMSADDHEQAYVPTVAAELAEYVLQLAAVRRRHPDDSVFSRLVSALDRGDITEAELAAMGFILLVAGHETTASLLSCGLVALVEAGEPWARLGRDPGMVRQVVEELIRFCAPVDVATPRFARCAIEIGATTITEGDTVFLALAPANRDPSVFHNPDRLDVDRDVTGHLGFGFGIHFCLGAQLARLQGAIAFTELSRRFPNVSIAAPATGLDWKPGLIMRGLRRLPVRLEGGV